MLSSLPFYVSTSIDVVILSLSLCKSIEPPRIALYTTQHSNTIYIFLYKKISLSLSPSQISKHCQESRETRENLKIPNRTQKKIWNCERDQKITESEDDDVKSLNQDVRWSGSAPDTSIRSDKDRYGLYSFRTASSVVEQKSAHAVLAVGFDMVRIFWFRILTHLHLFNKHEIHTANMHT